MKDRKTKRRYCEKQIEELMKGSKEDMFSMLELALISGAVPDEWMGDSYTLARAIITIFCRKEKYAFMDLQGKKDVKNLSQFI